MLKIIGQVLLVIVSMAYPFLWYYGREQGAFVGLAAAMCGLWLMRAVWQKTRAQQVVSVLLALFFAGVLVWQQPASMYWNLVGVSLMMLALFGARLFSQRTVIESLGRFQ